MLILGIFQGNNSIAPWNSLAPLKLDNHVLASPKFSYRPFNPLELKLEILPDEVSYVHHVK